MANNLAGGSTPRMEFLRPAIPCSSHHLLYSSIRFIAYLNLTLRGLEDGLPLGQEMNGRSGPAQTIFNESFDMHY